MFPLVAVQRKHRYRVVAAFAATALFGAACGSSDASSVATLEQVDATIGDTLDDPSDVTIDVAVDGELVDGGITTTAEADETADRTRIPPTKGVLTRSPDAEGDGNPPDYATTALVEVVDADGDSCIVCMWLADEPDERSQGLMNVFDLGVPIGMAFTWDAPTSGNFFMFNTPTPLSIAWFSPDGSYVSEADMEPCLEATSTSCERYGAGGEYTLAIEMFQGELGKVGIGPGSTAEVVKLADPATPTICPLLD